MVRGIRVKEYFTNATGSLFSNAGGVINYHTDQSINGQIQKISFYAGNYTATGSFVISVSGTGEQLLSYTSGTANGNVAGGGTVYTFVYPSDANNNTGSPQAFVQQSINGPIRIIGSGLGAGKSGAGINISFI